MKTLIKTMSALTLALSTSLAMAAEPGAWEKIKTFAHDKKEDAVAEGKKLLAATDKKIESMKTDVSKANADTRKAHEKNMEELRAKRKAAAAELERLEKSAANTWDATKTGFSNAYKDLHESVEKAAAANKAK